MSAIVWSDEATKTRVADLVKRVEAESAVELVVTVRARSASYRAASVLFGALAAFAGLAVYVYAETEFTDDLAPPALFALFVVASFVASQTTLLRRWLTPRTEQSAAVRAAAREAFVDQGIASTRERTGLLVYVSVFERRAEVIADIGLLRRDLDGELARALSAVATTIEQRGDLAAFEAALHQVGKCCATLCPPRADDVNELPDSVNVG